MLEDVQLVRIKPKGQETADFAETAESHVIENTIKSISRATRKNLSALPRIALVLLATVIAALACDSRDPYDLPFVNGQLDALVLKDPTLNHELQCLRVDTFDKLEGFRRDPELKKACADVKTGKTPEENVEIRDNEVFPKAGIPKGQEKWRRIAVKDESTHTTKYIHRIITDPIDDLSPDAKEGIANAERLTAAAMAKAKALDAYGRKHTAEQDKINPEVKGRRDSIGEQECGKAVTAIADPND